MAYTVTMSTQLTSAATTTQTNQTALKITVTGVTDFADQGVFVYAIDPLTSAVTFSHVAKPFEITKYPYNSLDLVNFYTRRNSLELFYATASLASEAKTSVIAEVKSLCTEMGVLTTYGTPSIVTVP